MMVPGFGWLWIRRAMGLLALGPLVAVAHPTTFAGGWAFMSSHYADMSVSDLNHSFSPRWSLGVQHRQDRLAGLGDAVRESMGVNAQLLVRRWNQTDSQGNLYVGLGGQLAKFQGASDVEWLSTAQADWESRRLYAAAMVFQPWARGLRPDELSTVRLRLGFAPFEGEFSELNVWFVVEAAKMGAGPYGFNQLFRFFYRTTLWEIGMSSRAEPILNLMFHWSS